MLDVPPYGTWKPSPGMMKLLRDRERGNRLRAFVPNLRILQHVQKEEAAERRLSQSLGMLDVPPYGTWKPSPGTMKLLRERERDNSLRALVPSLKALGHAQEEEGAERRLSRSLGMLKDAEEYVDSAKTASKAAGTLDD